VRGGPAGGRGEAWATNIPARHARRADSSRSSTSRGVWPYALSTNPGGSRARRVARRGVAFGGVRATKSQRAMTGEPRISPHPHTPHPPIPPPSLRSPPPTHKTPLEPPAPSSAGAGPYHLLQHSARACSEHSLPGHQRRVQPARRGCALRRGAAPPPARPARLAPAPARAKRATLPATSNSPSSRRARKICSATPRMMVGISIPPWSGRDQDLHHHMTWRGDSGGAAFLHPREPEGWHFPLPLDGRNNAPAGARHLGLGDHSAPGRPVRNRRCSARGP